MSNLETTFAFQFNVADTQVRSSEIDGEVGTLLLSGGPAKDEGGKHGLDRVGAHRQFSQTRVSAATRGKRITHDFLVLLDQTLLEGVDERVNDPARG